jgi:hypothetical protein
MARITRDREDLLLEATALVPRVMLRMAILGEPTEVFAGFRGDSLSIYFGSTPVYHFNDVGELRRAFVDDCLIKAEAGQLIGAVRERSDEQVVLASTPLSTADRAQFAADLSARLTELREGLKCESFELVGQSPHEGDGVKRLRSWLADWLGLKIAAVANIN